MYCCLQISLLSSPHVDYNLTLTAGEGVACWVGLSTLCTAGYDVTGPDLSGFGVPHFFYSAVLSRPPKTMSEFRPKP